MITAKDCPVEKNDAELVALVLAQPDYFLCIMQRYETKMRRYISRLGNFQEEEIDDLLQDIFIKCFKNLRAYDVELSFSAWLYRIAHNHTISHFRFKSARPQTTELTIEDSEHLASGLDIAQETDAVLLADKIKRTLDKLKPKHREVLALKFLDDNSYDEIADILQKPPGTVATLIHKAKKEFKKHWII